MLKGFQFFAVLFAVVFAISASSNGQVTIIDDTMNVNSSADYTVVNDGGAGGGDGELLWAYNYGSLGIPAAPGTTDGSTIGTRMAVNTSAGPTESYTLFHNTELVGVTDYTMTVDVWMNVWSDGPDTGSTNHAQIGVGADNTVNNSLFRFDGSCCEFSGSGHFVAVSGDGGDSSDYRHWRDNANGSGQPGPVNQFDTDYLSPDMNTQVNGDNFPFFSAIANATAPFPGSIGMGWATIKVEVSQTDSKIRYYVRGATAESTGTIGANDPPEFLQIIESDLYDAEGYVNFGLADLYAGVASIPEDQFAIFDNLLVTGSNLPGGGVDPDFNNDNLLDCVDVDGLVAHIVAVSGGATADLSFDLDDNGTVDHDDLDEWLLQAGTANVGGGYLLGDADLDGTVAGPDFLTWNDHKFQSEAAWCSGDFDADGSVAGPDFLLWNDNKFQSSTGLAVPEPAAASLVLLGGLAFFRLRRR